MSQDTPHDRSETGPKPGGGSPGRDGGDAGFWVFDARWRTVAIDARTAAWLGQTIEAVVGSELASWVGEDGAERVARDVAAAEPHAAVTREVAYKRAGGKRINLRLELRAWADEAGRFAGAAAGVSDPAAQVRAAQRAADRDELNALMLRLSHQFIRVTSAGVEEAINAALATLGRFADVSSCYLYEFDAEMASASKRYEWHAAAVPSTLEEFTGVTPDSMPTLFLAAAAGQTLRVNRLDELSPEAEPERGQLEGLEIGAFLVVPLEAHGRVNGLIGFDHHGGGRVWTDEEELLLKMSADMFAQALDRRGAHDRLTFHVNNAPLAVIEWAGDWRVQRWSPMAERIFGWTAAEVLGRDWLSWPFVYEEDMEIVQNATQRLISGEEDFNVCPNRNHTKDGRVIDCEWFNSVLRDHAGRVISILSFTRDVTQRLRERDELATSRADLQRLNAELEARVAERTAALRTSEERFRELAEHATDMISRHDDEGRFTYVSPACRRLLGYEPDGLIGKRPRMIVHPDDLDILNGSLDRLRRTTDVVRTTFRALRNDGGTVWLESSSRNEGKTIVVVTRDVTGRLETEERLRLIQSAVDQVRESVVITDNALQRPGPHIVYVNPAFTKMTGYEAVEVVGRSPRILQGPRTNQIVLGGLRDALTSGEAFTGETTNYRKDGSEYVVEWNVNPLRDNAGRITHWCAIQRDVTARKTAEVMSRVHREELAHVTRLSTMGEMASGLAHELNQPLAAINNYTNGTLKRLADGRLTDDALTNALQRVADQSDRAGQIIRRIRAFVTKRGTLRATEQIDALIRETLALAESDFHEHQARVELDVAEGLPPVNVDGIQIEQVLINLIRNAIESMEAAPAEQRVITIAATLDRQDHVCLTVSDRGSGLSESQRDHLFDPFFTTKDEGMGMGLTISQSIVQAHRGRLWATPRPGGGTVFHLTLPAAEPA